MKQLLLLLLLCILLLGPLYLTAQTNLPRFENDTLYTTSGYNIYKGQVLHLANGTSDAGYFRFIKFHAGLGRTDTYTLQNSIIVVDKLRSFKTSGLENHSIRIEGTVTYKNNSTAKVDLVMDFEKASESYAGLPAELTLPAGFITRQTEPVTAETKKKFTAAENKKQAVVEDIKSILVADEIKKLFDLYKAGALTKEEYEAQKKKLLDKQ
jgi:hypothetical protein